MFSASATKTSSFQPSSRCPTSRSAPPLKKKSTPASPNQRRGRKKKAERKRAVADTSTLHRTCVTPTDSVAQKAHRLVVLFHRIYFTVALLYTLAVVLSCRLTRWAGVATLQHPLYLLVNFKHQQAYKDGGGAKPHRVVLRALVEAEVASVEDLPRSLARAAGFWKPHKQKAATSQHCGVCCTHVYVCVCMCYSKKKKRERICYSSVSQE